MKTKTLLSILCSAFILWSCEQNSSLSMLEGDLSISENEMVNKALVSNYSNTSGSRDILYNVSFDRNTGWFTLFYLPSDVYSLLFGNNGTGGETGSGQNTKGKPGIIAYPIPAEETPPAEQTLNYILDIYVTDDNKILYPPVLLPYYHNSKETPVNFDTGTGEQTEQHFERNQYSDIFYNARRCDLIIMKSNPERADKIKYSKNKLVTEKQEETTENTVFYIIKDDKMYFHIDPSSAIFINGVLEVDKGTFHIATYKTEWSEPVCSGGLKIIPIITYDINITLKLIKGDPPINPESDENITLPVNRLYNIFVSEQVIHIIPLENTNHLIIPDQKAFYNSAYYINQDGSISILNSSGKQIAKYPDSYKLVIADEECKVMEIGGIPL